MWTDGRYFLQASQQMDNNWTIMKMGKVPLGVSIAHDENDQTGFREVMIRGLGETNVFLY